MSVSKVASVVLAISFSGATMAGSGIAISQGTSFQDGVLQDGASPSVYRGIPRDVAVNLERIGFKCSAEKESKKEKTKDDRPEIARPAPKEKKKSEKKTEDGLLTCRLPTLTELFPAEGGGGDTANPAPSSFKGQSDPPAPYDIVTATGGSAGFDSAHGVQGTSPLGETFAAYSFPLVQGGHGSTNGYDPVNGHVPIIGGGGIVTPIPEPSTNAMIALGLAVVGGWVARRRRGPSIG